MKLEIGHRWDKIGPDWVALDIIARPGVDIVADWSRELPFPDGAVDLIYASHVLEHIWWTRTHQALREAWRVLRAGGALELHVPDLAAILCAYLKGEMPDDWRHENPEEDYMRWVNGRIYAHEGRGEGDHHRAIFDRRYLRRCLERAGFSEIRDGAPVRNVSEHPGFDLAMTAVKT